MTEVNDPMLEVGGAATARVVVGQGPISDVAVSPDGRRLVATNFGRGSVSVIDTGTHRVAETVGGLHEPFAVAVGDQDGRAYVSTVPGAYDAIAVIDLVAGAIVAEHPLALSVTGLAVSPDGSRVYATRNATRGADLAVLDTASGSIDEVELAVAAGTTAECVRVAPDATRAYVAINGPSGGRLVVLRLDGGARVIDTIEIGLAVRDVRLSPDGATAYVASCSSEWGAVVDVVDTRTRKITATRKIDGITGLLTGLTLSADGHRAYLVSDAGVAMLSTRTFDVLDIAALAHGASCVAESPDARRLYIADYAGGVTVVPIVSAAEPTAHGRHEKRELAPAPAA